MIKVLCVNALTDHNMTLVSTLNMYGCEARGIECVNEAFNSLQNWEPHLVIYDVDLLPVAGHEFAKIVCWDKHPYRPLYMVGLTSLEIKSPEFRKRRAIGMEFGFDEIVSIPIELHQLLTWVNNARKMWEHKIESDKFR